MATFGYATMGIYGWSGSINNKIAGSIFTCPQNGTANSITVGLMVTDIATRMKCAIYRVSDWALIGQTQEVLVPRSPQPTGTVEPVWQTFSFSTPPQLYGGVQYCLVLWSESLQYTYSYIQYDDSSTPLAIGVTLTYTGTFPSTLSGFSTFNRLCSIYCDYTPTAPPQTGTLTVHAKTA